MNLQFTFKVNGTATAATSVVLANAAGTYGVKRMDTNEVVVAANTAMTAAETGVYRYALDDSLEDVPLSWVAKVVYNGVTYHFERETTDPGEANIGIPIFEHVPIIVDTSLADLRVAAIQGLTTKHGSTLSDRGRLYASIDHPGSYRVRVYADLAQSRLVMSGTTVSLGERFTLSAENGSGMSGYAWLEGYTGAATATLIPSFAVDSDVLVDPDVAERFPGWNETYGLAFVQAQQQRALLLGELPAAIPHLFAEHALAGFVPAFDGTTLPDLRRIANVDLLRVAQALLVKAASAEQSEHLEEWAAIAAAARGRFDATMKRLKEANPTPAERAKGDTSPSLGVSTFSRW